MVECTRLQNEVYKGTAQGRCINKQSDLFREIVVPEQCAACQVRMEKKPKRTPCVELARMMERNEEGERIKAQIRAQVQAQVQNQLLVIEPQSGDGPTTCPYRYPGKEHKTLCSMTGLPVTEEVCRRCDKETREHEAKFGEKVKNYFGAVRRWIANGRPSRSQEEINKLFKENCESCDRYDPEKHACKNCGCAVSNDSSPLSNKLAMASERCPLGRF